MQSPHDVTRAFEAALCRYTGAKYAVTTTSCTMAIQIALAWLIPRTTTRGRYCDLDGGVRMTYGHRTGPNHSRLSYLCDVEMPRFSYVGVPAAIRNAGGRPMFRDEDWSGEYQLKPLALWDSARRFTSGMFRPGAMQCVSFHWSKILGLSQGGAILHDNDDADAWLRRARFDGRTEGVDAKLDQVQYPSWHAYLSPEVAAHGLMKLSLLPKHNPDLPNSDYPDLSQLRAFQ